jgi:hypothetical protein
MILTTISPLLLLELDFFDACEDFFLLLLLLAVVLDFEIGLDLFDRVLLDRRALVLLFLELFFFFAVLAERLLLFFFFAETIL